MRVCLHGVTPCHVMSVFRYAIQKHLCPSADSTYSAGTATPLQQPCAEALWTVVHAGFLMPPAAMQLGSLSLSVEACQTRTRCRLSTNLLVLEGFDLEAVPLLHAFL